jgi:hypothetical protein
MGGTHHPGVRRAAAANAVSSRTWPMLPRRADAAITPANAPSTEAALPESGRWRPVMAGGRCRADAARWASEARGLATWSPCASPRRSPPASAHPRVGGIAAVRELVTAPWASGPVAWLQEADRLDFAVYAAIGATPTPAMDVGLRRLSRAADHSKLWVGCSAVLAVVGGGDPAAAPPRTARRRSRSPRPSSTSPQAAAAQPPPAGLRRGRRCRSHATSRCRARRRGRPAIRRPRSPSRPASARRGRRQASRSAHWRRLSRTRACTRASTTPPTRSPGPSPAWRSHPSPPWPLRRRRAARSRA